MKEIGVYFALRRYKRAEAAEELYIARTPKGSC
ncbi:hypothetical protein SNOG_01950 [Parastagonospora nodorum SN15]|uniref:Uncharacterized protein n=1 Tax=Phaeosphaeria nodorum (strain SN15 / ATCC MYA-4574 / FGSC 10173) TaxID=321614 RepID=Q0V214_PHANO|nr:hypothetical protein SNOG_01950 [Parastagonospora nodorum SN15]EAT90162.1 hypothetical protein SNOG_01950 [Parastagonospora nodorum SN15]